MNRNDNENKLLLIEKLLKESFWNDYTYTAELLLQAIEEKNKPVIIQFLERIIAGADFPTRVLKELFSSEELEIYLTETKKPQQAYFSRRHDRVIFNITGKGNPGVPAWTHI